MKVQQQQQKQSDIRQLFDSNFTVDEPSIAISAGLKYQLQQNPQLVSSHFVQLLSEKVGVVYGDNQIDHEDRQTVGKFYIQKMLDWLNSNFQSVVKDAEMDKVLMKLKSVIKSPSIQSQLIPLLDKLALQQKQSTEHRPVSIIGQQQGQSYIVRGLPTDRQKTVALLQSGIFGRNFVVPVKSGKKEKLQVTLQDCQPLDEQPSIDTLNSVVTTVRVEKQIKLLDQRRISNTTALPIFKNYSDQDALQLSHAELDAVIEELFVVSESPQRKRMLHSVFIKIVIDLYCSGDVDGVQNLLGVFMEMIVYPDDRVKSSCFDLLVNIGIHVQLLEDVAKIGDKVVDSGNIRINLIMDDLVKKVIFLQEWLLYTGCSTAFVWHNALKCFLLYVTVNGCVDFGKLKDIDIKVIEHYLRFIPKPLLSQAAEDVVVQILCYLLLGDDYNLRVPQLKSFGGINFIFDVYTSCSSSLSRFNLFGVIYQHILWDLRVNKSVFFSEQDQTAIYHVLKALDAADYLSDVVRYVPVKFVERFVRYVYLQEVRKDPKWFSDKDSEADISKPFIDKSLFVAIMYAFEQLAKDRMSLPSGLQGLYDSVVNNDSFSSNNENFIMSLLESSHYMERYHGYQIISNLLINVPRNSKAFGHLEKLFYSLAASQSYIVRALYLDIVEVLVMHQKQATDGNMDSLFKVVNQSLNALVSGNETHIDNLTRMLELIYRNVTVPSYEKVSLLENLNVQSTSENLLAGKLVFKKDLLRLVDIKILDHIFNKLPRSVSEMYENLPCELHWINYSKVLSALLLMIAECAYANLEMSEVIGGMNYFRQLVRDSDVRVSYSASQILIKGLRQEKPAQYEAIVKKFSQKLGVKREDLESNQYVLLQMIMNVGRK
ncbi:hypothetical protein MIR68_007240 [Amoeboaphelidium protococcarum]|nr:hypothetical protein MIR68_007240 [Amoeboaphelidium protococcarum]